MEVDWIRCFLYLVLCYYVRLMDGAGGMDGWMQLVGGRKEGGKEKGRKK